MNYVFILAILSVLILSFFLKASLLSNKGWVEMDSIHHLSMGLWVKQNCGLPDIIARYNQNEKYTYPPLLHIIISKFPEKKMWYAQFLGPVCDFAIGLMIGIYAGHDFGWTIAWIAVTSYAFTPYLFSAYIGASAEALAVTFLAFSLFILSLALNAQLSIQFPLVILSASGISAVILTHRSTTEALLAIVLVESIGLHQLIFVEATILGLIFSLTLLRGRLIVNLADQFRMIQLFALDKSKVYTRLLRSGKFLDFIEMVWEPRSVFVNFPLVIFIPMVFYLKLINISPFLFYWMLSLLILYVSWIPGKGLRRLGAIGPPLSIMVAEIASKVPWVLFFIFISVASALTLKYVHTIKPRKQFVSDKLIEACEFLKTIAKPVDLVLVIPTSKSYSLLFFTNNRVVIQGGSSVGVEFNYRIQKEIDRNPDISKEIERYRVKYVIKTKSLKNKVPGIIRFDNGTYCVLEEPEIVTC